MKGESRGDFSRDTFDPSKHFLRVAMQQGRVSLDADWNEQADILLHYMQTLARDIIGPFAGPEGHVGFEIKDADVSKKDFGIGHGRYYVDGILCENEKTGDICNRRRETALGYYDQPDYPVKTPLEAKDLLVYLDVWERHISYIEDDDIREKALGAADTASRSKVVWQVKAKTLKTEDWLPSISVTPPSGVSRDICKNVRDSWPALVNTLQLQPLNRGCLKARAKKPTDETNPCITSPEARYRGAENQLYRVEIHRGGKSLGNSTARDKSDAATFKWSRDNGAVAFPILDIGGNEVTLEHMGRDERLSLKVGDWVEILDDDYTLLIQSRPSPLSAPRPLARVDKVDLAEMKVTLKPKEGFSLPDYASIKDKHPLLRRWDHRESGSDGPDDPKPADGGFFSLFVEEGDCKEDEGWITLEDGVQICFAKPQGETNAYQPGDYWLIPARTATGDVEWPGDIKAPRPLPPHGIEHHYAPLAVLSLGKDDAGKEIWTRNDCRCVIKRALNPPCDQ